MKHIAALFFILMVATTAAAAGESVAYKVNGEPFEGYFISPSPDAPLVLLVHDWDGLTEYEVKRANMLSHTGELYKDRDKMRTLLQSALTAAKSKGGDVHNAVAVGYCFGGAAVLEFARSGVDMKGFVTFHGGLGTPEGQDYSKTKGKLLIMHGTADTNVTMDQFAKLALELEEKGVAHEMITYGGAPHAFTVFGSDRYTQDAENQSWKGFGEFLAETLN